MINLIQLEGRLPLFEGKFTPANGDKKSRMNWAMNVQLNTKNENGYYDEALVNFTAWGYFADQLQQISSLDKNDPMRKEFSNILVTGRFVPGYKDKDGNIQNSASLEVSEFKFTKRLPSNNTGEQAFAPKNAGVPSGVPGVPGGMPTGPMGAGRPGAPGVPSGRPTMPGAPGAIPTGQGGPRF